MTPPARGAGFEHLDRRAAPLQPERRGEPGDAAADDDDVDVAAAAALIARCPPRSAGGERQALGPRDRGGQLAMLAASPREAARAASRQ